MTQKQLAEPDFDVSMVWPGAYRRGKRTSTQGNSLTDYFHPMTDRYAMDLSHCGTRSNWYQFDTAQDASYYGHWCNPVLRLIVGFAEGDITVIECDTPESYLLELGALAAFDAEYRGIPLPEWREMYGCNGPDDHDGKHTEKLYANAD